MMGRSKFLEIFSALFLVLTKTLLGSLCPTTSDQGNDITQVQEGNFALPFSQQPIPLVSFSNNLLEQGQVQFLTLVDDYGIQNGHYVDAIPGLLYGVTDNFSAFFNIPIAVSYQNDPATATGLEDISLSLQYAFYTRNTKECATQAILMSTFFFPTGSFEKQPPTGTGAMSYLIAGIYAKTCVKWMFSCAAGALLTSEHHRNRVGYQYFYQGTVGRNIKSVPGCYILTCMVDIDGRYSTRDKVADIIMPDSGGNQILVTPSLFFSTKNLLLQFGIGGAIFEHLNGHQNPSTYVVVGNIGWTL